MTTTNMCYKKNYLSKVILRVDFGTNSIGQLTEKSNFSNEIEIKFPHISSNPMLHLQIDFGNEGSKEVARNNLGQHWIHKKTTIGTTQVVLAPTFMALEYGPGDYESFDTFKDEFTFLVGTLSNSFNDLPFDRIGLRYINEIRLPGKALDWDSIINKPLVDAVMTPAMPGGRLLRSMHQVVELHGDDCVMFNYGIFNPDFPAPAVQRFFILDIDCNRTGIIQKNEALECVKQLNEYATKTFEASIGEELRAIMGVKI